MGYYSALKEERNPAICNNMGDSEGHCVECNKPFTEEQIPQDSTYMRDLK